MHLNMFRCVNDNRTCFTGNLHYLFNATKKLLKNLLSLVVTTSEVASDNNHTVQLFYTEMSFNFPNRYSMILVGAAFFHQRFLELFRDQPSQVHQLVDETQNCDDIAMNFVVARQLALVSGLERPSGVFVKPVDIRNLEKDASSGYVGMWHRAEHMLQRSYCLNKLAQIYRGMPLRYSNMMISQFGFPSYANHKSRI